MALTVEGAPGTEEVTLDDVLPPTLQGPALQDSLRSALEEVVGPALTLGLRQVLWEHLESELRKVLREELERSAVGPGLQFLSHGRQPNKQLAAQNLQSAPCEPGSDESPPSSARNMPLTTVAARDDEHGKVGLQDWLAQRGMDTPLTEELKAQMAENRQSAPPALSRPGSPVGSSPQSRISVSKPPDVTPEEEHSDEKPSSTWAVGAVPWRGLRLRVEPPSNGGEVSVPRRAHMIGVVPGQGEKPNQARRQSLGGKRDRGRNPNLKCLEQQLANELFQANDLLPPEAKKGLDRSNSAASLSGNTTGGRLSLLMGRVRSGRDRVAKPIGPCDSGHSPRTGRASGFSLMSGKSREKSTDQRARREGRPSAFSLMSDKSADKRTRGGPGDSPSLSPCSSLGSFSSAVPAEQPETEQHRGSRGSRELASLVEACNPYVVDFTGLDPVPRERRNSSVGMSVSSPKRVPTCGELRRMQDQRLTSHLSLQYTTEESEPDGWDSNLEGISRLLNRLVTTITGVLPWSEQWLCLSMVYQWSILILMLTITGSATYRTYSNWKLGNVSLTFILAQESILAVGSLFALLGCQVFWRSKCLVEASRLLKAYSCKVDAPEEWDEVSFLDLLCSGGLWLLSLLLTVVMIFTIEVEDEAARGVIHTDHYLWQHFGRFTFSSAVLMGICQYILHTCQCLTKLVETFCYQAIEQPDFTRALHNWSLLQALCRTACSSIQFAFLALQATATALGLLSIVQMVNMDTTRLMGSIPALVIAASVFRTSIWAAAVTDKCLRVPMLVNSVSVGVDLDPDRLYVVQYIEHSQAGFYLFELRLTSATVLKTAYVACAGCFFLAARLL